MQWFKFSREILHDPRLNAFTKTQKFDLVTLISLSCWGDEPGVISLTDAEIAYELHMSAARWERFSFLLSSRRMIRMPKDGRILIAPWLLPHYTTADGKSDLASAREEREARQEAFEGERSVKPSDTAAARAERQARSRAAKAARTENVTPPETECHAPYDEVVTPPDSRAYANEKAEADVCYANKEAEQADAPLPPLSRPEVESSALPAPPAFGASAERASAPLRSGALLSRFDENDLLNSGPPGGSNWTLTEIDFGYAILRERRKIPKSPKGLLHAKILPEVRAGKRPEDHLAQAVRMAEAADRKRESEARREAIDKQAMLKATRAEEEARRREECEVFAASLSAEERELLEADALAALPTVFRQRIERTRAEGREVSVPLTAALEDARRAVLAAWLEAGGPGNVSRETSQNTFERRLDEP